MRTKSKKAWVKEYTGNGMTATLMPCDDSSGDAIASLWRLCISDGNKIPSLWQFIAIAEAKDYHR